MDRRRFLIGLGSASVGGSALLGSGAFSRVESHRSVSIAVAEDPDAYLGLSKCDTPNGSYAHLDDNGHLEILMNDENPHHPRDDLGAGVNSNSQTWFDRVFQICNQGKETVCVWIEDDDRWPRIESTDGYVRRVEFYYEDDDQRSIIGVENGVSLDVGDCICVGVHIKTHGLSEGDTLLDPMDDTITIHADVDGDCGFIELPECPMYGTSRSDPTEIVSIRYNPITDEIEEQSVGSIPDDFPDSNYPNGVAFDPVNEVWYFAEKDGTLKTMNEDGDLANIVDYGVITPDGEPIAGAAFHDGEYYFIPNGGDTLMAAQISLGVGDTSVSTRIVTGLDWSNIGLGDIAIDRNNEVAYVSTVSSNDGAIFFSIDLNDFSQQLVSDGNPDDYAVGKQIAFADNILWAHNASGGQWFTVSLLDGSLSDEVATTREYTDLAQCGLLRIIDPLPETEVN